MFKKKYNENPETFDTLIGAKTTLTGNVECEGIIRVDGTVNGDMKIAGDIFIGNSGIVTGNISASNIFLSGTVEGNIQANGVLRMLSTAKLYGDIQVHSFVADEGALFQGKCSMVDIQQNDRSNEKTGAKKSHSSKDYKKSSVISQDDEKQSTESD